MVTIGVDYHKRTSSYRVLDDAGQTIRACKFENTRDAIRLFIAGIEGPKQLAMEATRSWGLYHDTVRDLVDVFYLGHPLKMKAITESETKHDCKDAELIARLTRSNFLPTSYVSALDTRQLRGLLRFRRFLVQQRASLRHQVHTLIDRNFFPAELPGSFKNFFCKRGLEWLAGVALPARERFILDQCLASHGDLSARIASLERFLQGQTYDLPGLAYLRTTPGFRASLVNALTVLLEAGDIARFHKARGFAHYAGLIPREFSSGEHHRTGRLVKHANMHLRTAFIESTLTALRAEPGLRAYYMSVKKRSGSSDAVIATARKLACAAYHVLKEQRPYRAEPLPPAAASKPYAGSCR